MIYIDVDALCKLAHWNILPLLPELLECQWNNIKTVSSLSYRIKKSLQKPDGKLFSSTEAAKVAIECVEKMGSFETIELKLLDQLVEIPQIDPGEAILLAAAYQDATGILITGDKRAVRALAGHSLCREFPGKIICLEQILLCCLNLKGREWYLENIALSDKLTKQFPILLGWNAMPLWII